MSRDDGATTQHRASTMMSPSQYAEQLASTASSRHIVSVPSGSMVASASEDLRRERAKQQWLEQQLSSVHAAVAAYEAVSAARASGEEGDVRGEEDVLVDIMDAKSKLYDATTRRQHVRILRERLATTPALWRSLFADAPSAADAELIELCGQRDLLSSESLGLAQQLEEVTAHRLDAQRESAALRLEARALWRTLEASDSGGRREQTPPERLTAAQRRISDEVESLRKENGILRHLFLGLVAESHMDWSQDRRLSTLMMHLEQEPGLPEGGVV
mmetsp:Transcript_23119/g.74356  ORF Transcript_23119/g.74356 Transcript_23119/m.74356 type:complete len:274 (+) Transcript_23119:10-831(+)